MKYIACIFCAFLMVACQGKGRNTQEIGQLTRPLEIPYELWMDNQFVCFLEVGRLEGVWGKTDLLIREEGVSDPLWHKWQFHGGGIVYPHRVLFATKMHDNGNLDVIAKIGFSEVGRFTIDDWGPYTFRDRYPTELIGNTEEYVICEIEQQGGSPRRIEVVLIIKKRAQQGGQLDAASRRQLP